MPSMHLDKVKEFDSELHGMLLREQQRQMDGIELIPSENIVSDAVLEAMGSVPTNKYSEGYPGKRYYGGNEVIDEIENLAINRLKKLFDCEHANVQPLSGSPANMAAYSALLKPNDTIMGLRLDMGGHLTHGYKINFSGQFFKGEPYVLDKKTELLDYDEILKQAKTVKPGVIVSGYSAYPRKIDFKHFKEICEEVDAYSMADIAHIAGLIVGKQHDNPFPHTDVVTTTTHKTLRGPRGAAIMCKEEFAQAIDKAVFPGMQGGPHEHIVAAKAVAFKECLMPEFEEYAKQIVLNAKAMASELMEKGWRLVSNGTDNHLMLVDVWSENITGKDAELALEQVGIYCNKNTIPWDERSPFNPSGIRIGTPVLTTRGMKESESKLIAELIDKTLKNKDNVSAKKRIKQEVKELCQKFVFYD